MNIQVYRDVKEMVFFRFSIITLYADQNQNTLDTIYRVINPKIRNAETFSAFIMML